MNKLYQKISSDLIGKNNNIIENYNLLVRREIQATWGFIAYLLIASRYIAGFNMQNIGKIEVIAYLALLLYPLIIFLMHKSRVFYYENCVIEK